MLLTGRRFLPIAALLIVAVLLVSGCAPRAGAGILASASGAEETVVDMPALLIEYGEDGEASLFGTPVSTLGGLLGADLSSLSLGEETIQDLSDAGIQNIVINNLPSGMRISVNGKNMPSLVWDAEALAALTETLNLFDVDLGPAGALLPMLPNIGMGVAVQLPVESGATRAPLAPAGGAMDPDEALNQFANAKAAQPRFALTIDYNPDGTFEIGGINQMMLGMLPIPWDALELPPDTLEGFTEQGIQSVGVSTVPGGLLLAINGNTLPYIQWAGEGEINNMLDLAGQLAGMGDGDGAMGMVGGMLQQLRPVFNLPGLSVTVSFPG